MNNFIRRVLINKGKTNAGIIITAFLLNLISFFTVSNAQQFERISTAKRSDGKGYVIRLHLSAAPDSFFVFQPSAQMIQLALYQTNMDMEHLVVPKQVAPIVSIDVHPTPYGAGIDINLEPNTYFVARGYPDANKKHILIGLTTSTKKDVDILSEGMRPIDWNATFEWIQPEDEENDTIADTSSFSITTIIPTIDPRYSTLADQQKFDVVVIDAGHGGHDPGSIGPRKTKEKDVTLAVAKKLGKYIEDNMPDVKVYYTRDKDVYIHPNDRGPIANKLHADLFISIHCNSNTNRNASGTETYFMGLAKTEAAKEVMMRENAVVMSDGGSQVIEMPEDDLILYELNNASNLARSQLLAAYIEDQFKARAQRKSRGVKQAPFAVLWTATMPSILIELGFISNPVEERYLASEQGQTVLASAIFRAVRTYREDYERNLIQKNGNTKK